MLNLNKLGATKLQKYCSIRSQEKAIEMFACHCSLTNLL
uniref:Uncharacterized protein n=1 Tax=Arundo donax TaxID=35708 RepID=A0A0A8Y3L9_ARUDO